MRNKLWKKLIEPRILKRIYEERLGEPLIYNLASVWMMFFGSTRQKIEYDLIPRNAYSFCILKAADLAKESGADRVAILEFGVAAGAGLLNMCYIADKVTKETGIGFEIIGFDSGVGMPPPRDYRDHPEKYFTGDYPVTDKDALVRSLPPNARIYFGPLTETLKAAEAEITSPLGFISIDVDYYWSTLEALQILNWAPERYLPWVPMYFDDVQDLEDTPFAGELAALHDFNQQGVMRKVSPMNFLAKRRIFKHAIWHDQVYFAHIFDHPWRAIENVARRRKVINVLTNPYLEGGLVKPRAEAPSSL